MIRPRAIGSTRNSVGESRGQKWGDVLVSADLLGQRPIGCPEDQPGIVPLQPQPPVARGVLADLDGHVTRNVVLGEFVERFNDLVVAIPAAQAFQIDSGVMR